MDIYYQKETNFDHCLKGLNFMPKQKRNRRTLFTNIGFAQKPKSGQKENSYTKTRTINLQYLQQSAHFPSRFCFETNESR